MIRPTPFDARGYYYYYSAETRRCKSPAVLGGAAAFSPLSLPGLILWADWSDIGTLYQTEDTSTPVTANGQKIGRVTDKSGSDNHLLQATDARRPIYDSTAQNGLGGVTFETAATQLLAPATMALGGTTASVFCVIKGDTPQANARAVAFLADGQSDDFNNTGSAIFLYYPAATTASGFRDGDQLSNGTISDGAFHQIGSIYDGTNHTLYIDGTGQTAAANSDTFAATGVFPIGANASAGDAFNGVLLELVITDTALNAAQRTALGAYFTAKWDV